MLGASQTDVIFAQQFDMPLITPDDESAVDMGNREDLTLEQQFNSYHYQDVGYNDIKDEHGIKVYSAEELKRLINKEIPLAYVEAFKELRTVKSNPLFDARDIVKFYQNDISRKDLAKSLKKLNENNLNRKTLLKVLYAREYKHWRSTFKDQNFIFCNPENFRTLYSLSLVKRSYSYFEETDKPNLLITYPAIDEKKAFFSSSARELIKSLSESYDIWFATVYDENDLYKAIRKTPDIDLLILSGHGSKESIQLNNPVEGFEELSYIDTSDKELKKHLKRLTKKATIFLNSCSTGKGEEGQSNLANRIAELAPGRNVIAATRPFSISEVRIKNAAPLEIDIPGKLYTVRN